MNIIKAASAQHDWGVDLSEMARIWKGGCIIRAKYLDRIKSAYKADPALESLLLDDGFAKDLVRCPRCVPRLARCVLCGAVVAHPVVAFFALCRSLSCKPCVASVIPMVLHRACVRILWAYNGFCSCSIALPAHNAYHRCARGMQTERLESWKSIVKMGVDAGIATPGMSASLNYFQTVRREMMPANLVQAQRDFFGSHTYERNDGKEGSFHTVWDPSFGSSDSITTTGYNN